MKITILKRLIFGYATIMLLVIFFGAYTTIKLGQLNNFTRQIYLVDVTIMDLTERLSDRLFFQVIYDKKYFISKDRDFYNKFRQIMKYLDQDIEKLEFLMTTNPNRNLFAEAKQLHQDYFSLFMKEVGVMKKDPNYPRKEYQKEKEKIIDEINNRLITIMKMARLDRDAKIHESLQTSYHVQKITYTAAGFTIIVGMLISFINTRSINQSIIRLQKKTKDIAAGKFVKIPDFSSPLEIKELADDFNLMIDRLKELDEMKTDFISHVSHNLRTPLTAIKEATAMLIEGTYADNPLKKHELLTITKEECERLIDSVNRILDLSRMEAKMMDYQLKKTDILSIIQESVLKQAPVAQRKKIDLELRPTSDLPSVKLDKERIRQVMENLISNALKFSSEGGEVVINAYVKNDDRRFIEVAVADTGCGIPEEDLERIFDKFKRIDRGRATARGTGLGLSIAKHIIADHGGKIWAQSKPGKGCTFFFTLPV